MSLAQLSGVPLTWTQGDTVVFAYSDAAFSSSAWRMRLAMLKDGIPTVLPVAVAASDGSFAFTFAPSDTAPLLPGRYVARLVATSIADGTRVSLAQCTVFITPDLTAPLAPTQAMKALASLKTGHASLTAGTIQTFSGGGQSWTKKNLSELRREMDRLQVIVNNELTELGLSTKGGAQTIVTRFYS